MTNFRLGVRDLVADILAQRVPDLSGRIYRAREWPLQEHQTPAALVYGYQEEKTGPDVHGGEIRYEVSCIMSVQVMTQAASRHTEIVERELELLCQRICTALLTAPALLGEAGAIERIASVKTTLNIDARTGEKALGQALVAFDLRWSETYTLPPDVDCDCPTLTFRVIPPA
jgi:hypothetical protein